MICSKKRCGVCVTLLFLNVAFIWINSLLPQETSAAFSKLVGSFLEQILPGSFSPSEGDGHGILRKMAHFTEFCSLGVLLSWLARMIRQKKWEHYLLPAAAGFLTAAVDETIQMFIPGRGPHIRDVGIDTLGVLCGMGILSLVAGIQKYRYKKSQR